MDITLSEFYVGSESREWYNKGIAEEVEQTSYSLYIQLESFDKNKLQDFAGQIKIYLKACNIKGLDKP